jgi:hypothetical protein
MKRRADLMVVRERAHGLNRGGRNGGGDDWWWAGKWVVAGRNGWQMACFIPEKSTK